MEEKNKVEEIEKYCLNCKTKPCSMNGCPLNNDIPAFIHEKDSKKGFEILCNTTVLPAICGRICPHAKQCQGSCIRGIKGEPVEIGFVEKTIGDIGIEEGYKIPKFNEVNQNIVGKKVAVIGGGPAGLTCSAFLARNGINVTIFEKNELLGGILTHGIPEFRLPKEVTEKSINKILELGINVKFNKELGKNLLIEELQDEFDAIFVAIGANIPAKMGVEGESIQGVYGGNSLLETGNHPDYKNKKVAVIGGGNVAMDCARTIIRMGAEEVNVIYRRAREQMPAETKEIESAENEGVKFLFQTNIVKILGSQELEESEKINNELEENNSHDATYNATNKKRNVSKIECVKTKLVSKPGETRLSPVNIEGSNFVIPVDYVIMATGSNPDENVIADFEKNRWGYINVDENMQTSIPKVFAGGDIVGEKATVAWAAKSGRNSAEKIIQYLENKNS